MSSLPDTLRTEPHAEARSKAVASRPLRAGSVIALVPALATSLLHSQKGLRCDLCHRRASRETRLSRCSGCASYWYCSTECQNRQWKAHHRRMCKNFDRYAASATYQGLFEAERTDAILLSHLVAEKFPKDTPAGAGPNESSFTAFLDLLGDDSLRAKTPLLCGDPFMRTPAVQSVASDYFSRFGRNNFIVHSHLNSYAHGIFPLASRLFNHSCVPNAAAKYQLIPHEAVKMEVIALRDIEEGEEILINYLDPALPIAIRDTALSMNYSFKCTCAWCAYSRGIHPQAPPPRENKDLDKLEMKLRVFVFGEFGNIAQAPRQGPLFAALPAELYPLLHESYLPELSEQFSRTSHDLEGNEDNAIMFGVTMLALYTTIYPPNYPQIGIHALEVAKTAWNAAVLADPTLADTTSERETIARACVALASQVLAVWGPEGDEEGGPLEELEQLRALVN